MKTTNLPGALACAVFLQGFHDEVYACLQDHLRIPFGLDLSDAIDSWGTWIDACDESYADDLRMHIYIVGRILCNYVYIELLYVVCIVLFRFVATASKPSRVQIL